MRKRRKCMKGNRHRETERLVLFFKWLIKLGRCQSQNCGTDHSSWSSKEQLYRNLKVKWLSQFTLDNLFNLQAFVWSYGAHSYYRELPMDLKANPTQQCTITETFRVAFNQISEQQCATQANTENQLSHRVCNFCKVSFLEYWY